MSEVSYPEGEDWVYATTVLEFLVGVIRCAEPKKYDAAHKAWWHWRKKHKLGRNFFAPPCVPYQVSEQVKKKFLVNLSSTVDEFISSVMDDTIFPFEYMEDA